MRLVFLGPPGAGKGTQAALLAQECNLAHIASGDLFRQAVAREDELGRKVKDYLGKGLLVPDELAIALILRALKELPQGQGFILDGFPRTLEQARALDAALDREGVSLDYAVYIEVSEEELLRRLTGRWTCRQCQAPYNERTSPPKVPGRCDRCGGELYQRPDDREDVIKQRLQVYLTQTAPLLDYYKEKGKLISVEGGGEVAEVAERIRQALSLS